MLSHFGIFYEVERKSGRSKPFYHYGVPPLGYALFLFTFYTLFYFAPIVKQLSVR